MLTFFKVNSEQPLTWCDDPLDLFTFIVIVTVIEHEFGVSTYLVGNSKLQSIVASKNDVLGLFTVIVVSQFDVKTETGVEHLQEGMSVIGLNALNAFLDANRKQPFLHAELKRISEAATAVQRETEQEKAPDLDYPALSPYCWSV